MDSQTLFEYSFDTSGVHVIVVLALRGFVIATMLGMLPVQAKDVSFAFTPMVTGIFLGFATGEPFPPHQWMLLLALVGSIFIVVRTKKTERQPQ